jgi:hypothetical protein
VPCPKGIELEVGYRQLKDLKTLSVSPRLHHGMAELLNGVIVELSKNIKAGDHLVIIEGFGCPLAEKENMLEHSNDSSAYFVLDDRFFRVFGGFTVARRIGLFIGVYAPFALGLTPGFEGIVLGTRHYNLSPSLEAVASRPHHCERSSRGHAAVNH